jgi:hypothetical protein
VTGQSRNVMGGLWANRRELLTFCFYRLDGRKKKDKESGKAKDARGVHLEFKRRDLFQ